MEIQIWKKKRYLKKIFENWPKCCGDVKQISTEFPKDLLTKSNNFAYVFPKAYTLLRTSIDILKISHKKGMVVENGGRTIHIFLGWSHNKSLLGVKNLEWNVIPPYK